MIIWTKAYETGSAALDEQHRTLIDHINLLGQQAHLTNPTRQQMEYAVHLVDYLETYANIHFAGEEQCMESHRCPAHAENRQAHELFRGFIRDYKRQCAAKGFQAEPISRLHQAMQKWIQEHILKVDTQLRPCLQK